MDKRRYVCTKYPPTWEEPKRQGCMILLYPGDTALFTSKNLLWVRFWVTSNTERIIVVKPRSMVTATLGFKLEVWERVWSWGFNLPPVVRRVWQIELEDLPLYPLYFQAYKYQDGEARRALEEILWNPRRLFEELQAVLQMRARLFVP